MLRPAELADRILTTVSARPVQLGDDLIPVHASIGVTTSRIGDTDRELVRRADVAMYQAKRAGSHTYIVYEHSMVDRRAEEAALSDDLDGALERGELHLVYQPWSTSRTAGRSGQKHCCAGNTPTAVWYRR